jgi:MerR family transcriptional regulator, light-induced transcriptional regulator
MTVLTSHTARPTQGRFGPFSSDAAARPFAGTSDYTLTQLERLAHACLRSPDAALVLIDGWRSTGHDLEDIYIRGIAPCARLLGQWWTSDTADFAQVTIASANLQQVLHRLSQEFCAPGADHPTGLSLLLATEPQSQHTMGAFMLSEFFRRRGWSVQLLAPQEGDEVLDHLRRDWFDALGLSISTGRQLKTLAGLLVRLRTESPNPHLSVLVGGPLVHSDPQSVESLGVDLVGGDARETVSALSQRVIARRN